MSFADKAFITAGRWPGETLCLKKRPTAGEPVGVMGYSAFGVITSPRPPIDVYLRGDDQSEDFKKIKQYASVDDLLADGWVVD